MKSIRELLPAQSDELRHLDLLRFLASAGIVWHHSREFFVEHSARADLTASGHALSIFVDLFFILSGFVIAYVYHARVGTAREYWWYLRRRLARLLPLHWATFAVAVVVHGLVTALGIRMRHAVPFDPTCMVSTLALTHTFIGCSPGEVFNGVSWSLSAEMVMYVLFPALLVIAGRLGRYAVAGGAAFAIVFVVATAAVHGPGFNSFDWAEVLPPLRALPAFFFGICLYFGRQTAARLPAPRVVLWVAFSALLAAVVGEASVAVVLALAYVVTIAAVAADQNSLAGTVVHKFAPLGQLTYSMYLIHPTLILILMNGVGDKFLKLGALGMAALAVLCYALIMVVSYASLVLFETPARRALEGRDAGVATASVPATPVR